MAGARYSVTFIGGVAQVSERATPYGRAQINEVTTGDGAWEMIRALAIKTERELSEASGEPATQEEAWAARMNAAHFFFSNHDSADLAWMEQVKGQLERLKPDSVAFTSCLGVLEPFDEGRGLKLIDVRGSESGKVRWSSQVYVSEVEVPAVLTAREARIFQGARFTAEFPILDNTRW